MPTIKRKVEMNLPQLIEWGWGNPSLSRNKRFFSKDENLGITKHCVHFNDFGYPEVDNRYCLEPTDTFAVEVEEEITLTTPLPAMLHVWKTGILGTEIKEVENKSIASQYTVCSTEFWLKQDDEMTLIWRDGRLIE